MFARTYGTDHEHRTTRPPTNWPNVVRLPGLCSQWDEHDAHFIRDILDMIGNKWSVLVIGTLANGPAATPPSPTPSPEYPHGRGGIHKAIHRLRDLPHLTSPE
ncbi:hypothetical protein [Streptomyces sp. NPDC002758]